MFKNNKISKSNFPNGNQILKLRDILNSYSDEELQQKHFYFEEGIVLDCIIEMQYGFLFITHINDDDQL